MFRTRYGCSVCRKHCQTAPGRTLHALVRHRVWMTGRRMEGAFNRSWGDLAPYNGDRARGVEFNGQTVESMRQKQAIYDRTYRRDGVHDGGSDG